MPQKHPLQALAEPQEDLLQQLLKRPRAEANVRKAQRRVQQVQPKTHREETINRDLIDHYHHYNKNKCRGTLPKLSLIRNSHMD